MATTSTPTDVSTLSTITSVTVFEEGAQVFRQAEIDIGKGVSKVIFENLPSTLKKDTLQVALRAASADQEALLAGILLKGISMESKMVDNEEYDQETSARSVAQKRVEVLDGELLLLDDAKKLLDRKKNFVGASFSKATCTSTGQEKESPSNMDVAYWKKMVILTTQSGESNLTDRRRIEEKTAKLQAERAQLNSTLIGHVPQKKKTHEFVAVLLDSKETVTGLGMQISYLMNEAKWKPTYDVRVTNGSNYVSGTDSAPQNCTPTEDPTPPGSVSPESAINLSYNGSVEQWSPEPWNSVSLDLSTAKPSMSGHQPTLVPWHMGLHKTSAAMKHAQSMVAAESAAAPGSNGSLGSHGGEGAAVSQTAISQSFTVQGKQTISNDRKVCRVTLVQIPLKATFDYVAVPKEQEMAYARAKVENTSEYFLMPGVSSIFLNDQYIAKSTIPKVCPKEKFDVDVGRDEGVLIERKQLKKQTSDESGLLSGKKTTITYKYELKVTNKKSGLINVKLEEAVPRSWQGEIEVKHELPVMPEEPSEDLFRDHQDILHCVLRPKPNTSETVIVQYKVTYPTGRVVTGL